MKKNILFCFVVAGALVLSGSPGHLSEVFEGRRHRHGC